MEQIELRGVTLAFSKGRNRIVAVTNINLALPKGTFLSITGASGSGKSALLRLFGGMEKPSAGTVWLNGKDPWHMNLFKRRRFCRETIAHVPRALDVRRYRTALDVVVKNSPAKLDKEAKRRHAAEMLDRVGLAPRTSHRPFTLSGGEQRRLALARALAADRPIILAEEPTGQVDPVTARGLLALIREINAASLTTFVVVTDDESLAREATRSIRLEEGRVAYDHTRTFTPLGQRS
ncbi:MAG: ATP-binding cassette domain-containing protein [Chloroflexota bacterium]